MKSIFSRRGRSQKAVVLNLLLIIFLGNLLPACKKVDEHANLIENQPWLLTEGGLSGLFNIWAYKYQQGFLVGDTATLVGKLFADRQGTTVEVGNVPAAIIAKGKVSTKIYNTRTGQEDSLEVIRFLITKGMGVGSDIPLTLHANGYSMQGLPLTIKLINTGDRRTDTSLFVDKLATWLPADLTPFQTTYRGSPFVNNSSVAGDGTIYFDNVNGIYKMAAAQVSPVLLKGSTLTDQQQKTFTIDVILSSVISPDGNSLLFSSIVTEDIPAGADSLYITRLCRMDMNSNQVVTLNRTTTLKGAGPYLESVGPFGGDIGTIKMAAARLKMDISGNIWFANIYHPVSNLDNPYSYSTCNSTDDWYLPLKDASYAEPTSAVLSNICRMDNNGQVLSLMQTNAMAPFGPANYITPGPMFSVAYDFFLLSPDGSVAYGLKQSSNAWTYDINQYNFAQGDIVNTINSSQSNFSFISFDTAVATKLNSAGNFPPPYIASDPNFVPCMILPNNDMLYVSTSSLFAYNFDNKSVYCYAGAENQNPDIQTRDTGPARFVLFNGSYSSSGQLRFCGLDKQGAIYYCTGGSVGSNLTDDFANGVSFYKLYPKK
ncbi:hypothetical protein ACX0G9_22265 [Flavitalea flava]